MTAAHSHLRDYIHGFSESEQQRLVRQAEYWSEMLIPLGLRYERGEKVLDIGCAVGATLGVICRRFPGILVSGIDLEPRQIEFAQRHLSSLGFEADLRVGDGGSLPYASSSFDHVYMMWLIEHVSNCRPILEEAFRVLKPGGSIVITETDYTTFKVLPHSDDWEYLEAAQFEHFAKFGNPIAGRQLGSLLLNAGFADVKNAPVGFHFFQGEVGLSEHAKYVVEFLSPSIDLFTKLGYDKRTLLRGMEHLSNISHSENSSITQIVYRGSAVKPRCLNREITSLF